jgi:hypothetical protein
MSLYISHIANAIRGREALSYLELGVWNKVNFNNIFYGVKKCVDIKPATMADFIDSTDCFFEKNTDRFDVIFIDACHRDSAVLADYNNAIKICNKALLMHDMFPESRDRACEDGNLCGTGYRILAKMWDMGLEPVVMECDAGMTLVLPPFVHIDSFDKISYEEFKEKSKGHKRVSIIEMLRVAGSL